MEIEKRAQENALGYTRQARDYRVSGTLGMSQGDIKASQIEFQSVAGAIETGVTGYSRSGN